MNNDDLGGSCCNIYLLTGVHYYDFSVSSEDENGFGANIALGINFFSIFSSGGSIEIAYQDLGVARTISILLGADLIF